MDDGSTRKNIKRIGASCVRKICSGQVVVDVATAVKELVENALDANATQIDVSLKEYGVDEICVSDNGTGISAVDFDGVGLRHATSKLGDFDDLESGAVGSFGFRGEALASACELSRELELTTRHASATCGTRLRYGRDGAILEKAPAPRTIGTTVIVRELFSPLPVRRADLVRNSKKHYAKALRTLHAYALGARSARLRVTNVSRGKTQPPVLQVRAGRTLRETVAAVFGSQFAAALVELVEPDTDDDSDSSFSVRGLVSRATGDGVGRAEGDRQFVFVNGRPVDLPKLTRAANEVWRQFEMKQKPALVLEIQVRPSQVDVNVAPDKREVVIENEELLINSVKETLRVLWAPTSRDARVFFPERRIDERRLVASSVPPATMDKDDQKDERVVPATRCAESDNIRTFSHRSDNDDNVKCGDHDQRLSRQPDGLDICSPDSGPIAVDGDESGKHQQPQAPDETLVSPARGDADIRATMDLTAPDDDEENEEMAQSDDELVGTERVTRQARRVESTTNLIEPNRGEQGSDEVESLQAQERRRRVLEASTDDCEQSERVKTRSTRQDSRAGEESPTGECEAQFVGIRGESEPDDTVVEGAVVRMSPVGTVDRSSRRSKRQMKLDDFEQPTKAPRVTGVLSDDDEDEIVDKRKSDEVMTLGKFGAVGPSKRVTLLDDEETTSQALPDENGHSVTSLLAGASLSSDDTEARETLSKVVTKDDFKRMRVVGQFNKGFILTRLDDSLFIVDQHAADEKFRYEANWRSQVTSQPLVAPLACFETAADELVVLERRDAFEANGFRLEIDPDAVVGQRAKIVALPVVKGVTFGASDARELLALLSDAPDDTIPRLPKLHTVFASKACRSAVMIGTALDEAKMSKLVAQLSDLNQPWNCPHGRPTMRHLTTLAALDLRARKARQQLSLSANEARNSTSGKDEEVVSSLRRDSDDDDDDDDDDEDYDEDESTRKKSLLS